jgi:hypothetical protein
VPCLYVLINLPYNYDLLLAWNAYKFYWAQNENEILKLQLLLLACFFFFFLTEISFSFFPWGATNFLNAGRYLLQLLFIMKICMLISSWQWRQLLR